MFYRITIALAVIILSCDTTQKVNREAVKEEMKSREVKRLTDSQIMEQATVIGDMAYKALQLGDSSLSDFINKINIQIDTMKWGDDPFSEQEKNILEAYQYAMENKLPAESGIQGNDGKIFYFCAPYFEEQQMAGVIILKILKKDIVLSIN